MRGTLFPFQLEMSRWDRLNAAFDAIPFHELPHWSLLAPLEIVRSQSLQFKATATNLTKLPSAGLKITDEHIDSLDAMVKTMQNAYDVATRARAQHGGRTPYAMLRIAWLKRWKPFKYRHFGHGRRSYVHNPPSGD